MNNLTSHEEITEYPELPIREEYRYPRENTVLKFVLYSRDAEDGKSYSIQCQRFVNGIKVCQATAADVSAEYDFAAEMYERIADGEVEPVHLHDVVYDLLP